MDDTLKKEALRRLEDARAQKRLVESDIREAYFFADPPRCRDVSSMSWPGDAPKNQAGETSTSLGMEVNGDFGGYLLDTFMPSTVEWADLQVGSELPEGVDEEAVNELEMSIRADKAIIFQTVKQSGFYAAAAQAFKPDAGVGTVALWIGDVRPAEPITTMPVPLRELEINIGPDGKVDDRFIVRHTRYRDLPGLLPGVELPEDVTRKIKDQPNGRTVAVWGWWRLWARLDDVFWQAVVMVGKEIVQSGELRGRGACPLVVGRFDPDPMFAFGRGPTIRSLPELRRLDEVENLKIENFDFQVHPPFGYPDDGIVNFSAGIEPGMGYPMRPGSARDFVKLSFEGNADFTSFEIAKVEERIRRLHYVDFAQQAGKTPPTAQQWLDEMMMAQKRIGTPGLTFWSEVPEQIFQRFRWLLQAKKLIPDGYEVNGRQVAVVPRNPTEEAQDHQKVVIATRLIEIGRASFPQTFEAICDQEKTLANLKKKMRDELVVFRAANEIPAAMQQLAGLIGGGGADPAAMMAQAVGQPA